MTYGAVYAGVSVGIKTAHPLLSFIAESAIFFGGLCAVAWCAQRLPIAVVPKQSFIAFVWRDVVNNRGLYYQPFRLAHYTQRMRPQISFPCFSPLVAVAALARCFALLGYVLPRF